MRLSTLPAGSRSVLVLMILLGAWASPERGSASVCITSGARSPVLHVNVRGTAEVRWIAGGERRYAVVRRGAFCAKEGVRMEGRDVSRETSGVQIPFKKVVKRTPDGAIWALQVWRHRPGRPRELRFSRWNGSPPHLTARATCCREDRQVVRGRVTYHRKAIARATVYVDCFACAGKQHGWTRLTRKRTTQNGRFSLVIPPRWEGARYRATLLGPNFGWVRAPDMRVFTPSALVQFPRRPR